MLTKKSKDLISIKDLYSIQASFVILDCPSIKHQKENIGNIIVRSVLGFISFYIIKIK